MLTFSDGAFNYGDLKKISKYKNDFVENKQRKCGCFTSIQNITFKQIILFKAICKCFNRAYLTK